MNNYSDKIAITTGDPNGIGAEITIKALNALDIPPEKIVLITNSEVLAKNGYLNRDYEIINIPYSGYINQGKDTISGGEFAFKQLETACKIYPRAIVTAPVSKKSLHLSGHYFNGQTEVLEHFLAGKYQKAEMLFMGSKFRVFLLTRHTPIKDICLTEEMIISKIERLQEFFVSKTKLKQPKFGLCALNPHAGECGVIGNEEIEIMIPAIQKLRESGINISNPISADNLMSKALNQYIKGVPLDYDCYIAAYHDQGLIPIKAVAMEETVNMTIGLDIIRTSPSHGTAFDIAGQNKASAKSMIAAISEALNI